MLRHVPSRWKSAKTVTDSGFKPIDECNAAGSQANPCQASVAGADRPSGKAKFFDTISHACDCRSCEAKIGGQLAQGDTLIAIHG